jgi:hypothetical protein
MMRAKKPVKPVRGDAHLIHRLHQLRVALARRRMVGKGGTFNPSTTQFGVHPAAHAYPAARTGVRSSIADQHPLASRSPRRWPRGAFSASRMCDSVNCDEGWLAWSGLCAPSHRFAMFPAMKVFRTAAGVGDEDPMPVGARTPTTIEARALQRVGGHRVNVTHSVDRARVRARLPGCRAETCLRTREDSGRWFWQYALGAELVEGPRSDRSFRRPRWPPRRSRFRWPQR